MSASKDKIIRKQQVEAGTDKRSIAEAKAKAAQRKSRITYSVVAVIVVVLFAFIFIYNSSWPSRHTTAVTINGVDYTPAQVNYYYSMSYLNFYNTYYTYVAMGYFFDTDTSLADQSYSEDMTWRDYFMESALDSMEQIQALCDAAEEAGFTLTDEQQEEYESELEEMESSWESLGYSSLAQYININYGKGVDEDLISQELYRTTLASAYAEATYDGYEYTSDELDEYYSENADTYDIIDYAYYSFESATDDEDEETDDTTDTTETEEETVTIDAQAVADAAAGTDLDGFTTALAEADPDAEPTERSYAGSNLPSAYSEWLLDADRQVGDTTVAESDGMTYIVMFLGRDTGDYNLVSFRHILIQAEDTDEDGEYSDEEKAAAEEEAQALYEEWQSGDATEDSFAELANESSDDTGSNTTGGLYEDVYQDEMVDVINEWLFDESREAGDTAVLSYDGSSYTGTHVVYFVGMDELTYAQYQADSAKRTEDYNSWLEELTSSYEAETHSLALCGKNH